MLVSYPFVCQFAEEQSSKFSDSISVVLHFVVYSSRIVVFGQQFQACRQRV